MSALPFTLAAVRQIKNRIIGNPLAKQQLAQDEPLVRTLVDAFSHSKQTDVRVEAAHAVASLSYGSEDALATLLRANAHLAFLFSLSKLSESDTVSLRAALARGLRTLAISVSDIIGPSQWELKADRSAIRGEAKDALSVLFLAESLDVYLSLLSDASSQVTISIAQLLASAIRSPEHRKAVSEWLPPDDRAKETKAKRGWEKSPAGRLNPTHVKGGWVALKLIALLRNRDHKVQEAALSALAALSKDNPTVSVALTTLASDTENPSSYHFVLSLSKSRHVDVQLAASLCAAHILRASQSHQCDHGARTIMSLVNSVLTDPSDATEYRIKACFILYYLITDDMALCYAAYERGCLTKLAAVVDLITPDEVVVNWDENEAERLSSLREAALTAIAAMSLFNNDIRRAVTDELQLLSKIATAMSHRHVGNRYAACQCIRALSRAVAVVRTSIVDSGLGMLLFAAFKKEDEDRRVTSAALLAVCNIVNDFSPLRPTYLEQGVVPRLTQILHSGDVALRMNALWAIRNLCKKSSTETKRDVMEHLTWAFLAELLSDADDGVQEQAFGVIRNLAENENGIDMVFTELGSEVLLEHITTALSSTDELVVLQATSTLTNLVNGSETQQNQIITHPQLLTRLRTCLADARADIKRQAVNCVLELVRRDPKRRRVMMEAGIVSTLRHLCEWTGMGSSAAAGATGMGMPSSPMSRTGMFSVWGTGAGVNHHPIVDDEKGLYDNAKIALDWLEHGDVYHTAGAS